MNLVKSWEETKKGEEGWKKEIFYSFAENLKNKNKK